MSFFTRVRELLHSPTSVTGFTNSSNYSDNADALFIFAIAMLLVNIRFAHAWVPILEWVLINAIPNIHRMPTLWGAICTEILNTSNLYKYLVTFMNVKGNLQTTYE